MKKKPCAWCYYARMKTDICGIYCTGGFENPDGTCDHFRDSRETLTERTVSMDDKLIEALRLCVHKEDTYTSCTTGQADCPFGDSVIDCEQRMKTAAADCIEELTARLTEKDKQLAAAVEFIQHLDREYSHYIADWGFERWRGPQEAGEVEREKL